VLTRNEEAHIERCIRSLDETATDILVVDSGSTDGTVEIAKSLGARVVANDWVNYATQFNWALTQLQPATEWVLRLDADEVLSPRLRTELAALLPTLGADVDGIIFRRRIVFQGREIRHGGVGGVRVLRMFRHGRGRCEQRWMDEHIKVEGRTVHCRGDIVDRNLNPLSWWIEKHNRYASREAVDLLNLKYGFLPKDSVAGTRSQAGIKRWMKETVYARLPIGMRAGADFFYRYFLRLGFLDGRAGTAFHVLQGFWYRYLVDQKVAEVKRHMAKTGDDIREAIGAVLGIEIR
jgi:glycosyltransferase involved in cell wall biosynthesis